MQWRPRELVYGAGMAGCALALAWLINVVFQRSWAAVSLFLLAMLIVILLQRMLAGGIPEDTLPDRRSSGATGEQPPPIRQETAHLTGADTRYGWMALPAVLTFAGVLISTVL